MAPNPSWVRICTSVSFKGTTPEYPHSFHLSTVAPRKNDKYLKCFPKAAGGFPGRTTTIQYLAISRPEPGQVRRHAEIGCLTSIGELGCL